MKITKKNNKMDFKDNNFYSNCCDNLFIFYQYFKILYN